MNMTRLKYCGNNIERKKMRNKISAVEVSIYCPNCSTIETLDMLDGLLNTVRMEEHGGRLCRAIGKYYQFANETVYHKCTLTGCPCEIRIGNSISI